MREDNQFWFVWRGWTIAVIAIFLPITILFIIFVPEQRTEMWPAIFIVPLVAAGQGVLIAIGVLLGNKLWSLIGRSGRRET
jgi:hypothetical protein